MVVNGYIYLVGGDVPTPLKNTTVRIMIPNRWKNNPNVPNHQSVTYDRYDMLCLTITYK
jgi:hypothetical protein